MVPLPGSECAFQCINRQEWRLSERPSARKPKHSGANAYLLGSVDSPQGFTELAQDIVALPLDTLNSPAKNESTDYNLVGRLALHSERRQVVRQASLACQGDTRRDPVFPCGQVCKRQPPRVAMSNPPFVRSGRRPRRWIVLFGIAYSALLPLVAQSPPSGQRLEQRLLEILESRCQACHNNGTQLGDLALDSDAGLRQGGAHGRVVVPGKPQASRLYRRVARLEEPFMPMQGEPLETSEVTVIKDWIEAGANWPASTGDPVVVSNTGQTAGATPESTESSEARFFRERIHPALKRCQSCHDDALKYYGLSLETRESLLYGGLDGPVLVPGEPEASRLYRKAARLEPHFMPSGPVMLSDQEIKDLYQWIKRGALWAGPGG